MRPRWTGNIVKVMHVEEITQREVAAEMGISTTYLSMLLNGARTTPDSKARVTQAVNDIRQRRKEARSNGTETA